ncbi:MAG: hypothetical protein ACE5G2_05930 [Candidatus Krumholzibacteriia bacterium]
MAGLLACSAGIDAASAQAPTLHPRSVEIGVAGSLTSVEGTTQGRIQVRGGPFLAFGPGLTGLQAEIGFTRARSLKQLDLQGMISWQMAIGDSGVWPYLGAGGGVQHEWLGSFRTARYPLGIDAGVRVLLGSLAGIRTEYRYRRFLSDPVRDTNEHQIILGISLFLNNRPE